MNICTYKLHVWGHINIVTRCLCITYIYITGSCNTFTDTVLTFLSWEIYIYLFIFFNGAGCFYTWFYSNPGGKLKPVRSALFKARVFKHWNQGETVANQPI